MYYNNFNAFPYQSNTPRPLEIPHVNGTNGAQAFQMPCNSAILLLDDNAPIVYHVKTDSACYKTITPYTITEYKPAPAVDVGSLAERIEAIERRLNESDTKPDATPTTTGTSVSNFSNLASVSKPNGSNSSSNRN